MLFLVLSPSIGTCAIQARPPQDGKVAPSDQTIRRCHSARAKFPLWVILYLGRRSRAVPNVGFTPFATGFAWRRNMSGWTNADIKRRSTVVLRVWFAWSIAARWSIAGSTRHSWLPCSSASGSRCLGSAHNAPATYSGRLRKALSALHTARFAEQRRKPCRGHGRLTGGLSIFVFAAAAVAGISSAYRRCRKQWHRRGHSSNRRSILGFAAVAIGISVGGAARHEQREHQCCDFHDTPSTGSRDCSRRPGYQKRLAETVKKPSGPRLSILRPERFANPGPH